jgi:uncharacterized protein (DUF486 family)
MTTILLLFGSNVFMTFENPLLPNEASYGTTVVNR